MPYKDKEKQREYMRLWIAKRRQDWIDAQGGACVKCGRNDLPFEVDHKDRLTKADHRVWSWSGVRRAEELAKCQLLCNLCHWEKTGKENTLNNHGLTLYKKGCRCETCVSMKREENSRNRKRVTQL